LGADDVSRAIVRFIHASLFHVPRAADRARLPVNTQAFDAARINVEELILNATATDSELLRFLSSEQLGGGGPAHNCVTAERSGLRADFLHVSGVIPWRDVIRHIRNAPRHTLACLTCGGEFTTTAPELPIAYNETRASIACRFWRCSSKRRAFVSIAGASRAEFVAPKGHQFALFA
jgi:hypothetical protein